MQRMPFVVITAMVAISFAGCLDDDHTIGPNTQQDLVVNVGDSFVDGSHYSNPGFDPMTLSAPVYGMLPVEQVYVTMSDGVRIENGVYRPDTDVPSPIFINFSPYHGDKAAARGDGFGQYLIDNFVPRGYTVILSSIRGTGQSEGCFEVASDREALDVKEVVDHFAAEPWSNGLVAAGGKSYDSTTQNGMIAKFPSDALRGIFHVSGITDMYEYTFHNGVPARIDSAAFTSRYALGQSTHEYGSPAGAAAGDASANDEDAESLMRLSGEGCTENANSFAMPAASTAAGLKTDYWIERDWTQFIADSTWDGSIFFYHGFHDWNVQPSHILPWLENLPEQIDAKVWLHQDRENLGHLYPMRADWNMTMLRWLDHELKGIDNHFWDEPKAELQGSDGLWRAEMEYPPQRAEWTAYSPAGAATDWEVVIADDDGLRYSGAPRLTIEATLNNPDPVVSAVLYRMDASGTRHWINEGVMRAALSPHQEELAPVTPGETREFVLDFYAQENILAPGESWVISMTAPVQESIVSPAQEEGITYDMSTAVLELPLVPAGDIMEHQPAPTDCFAC